MTSADGGYDLAHEALVRAWPRLRVWLDEDASGSGCAATWPGGRGLGRARRADAELYRGARLGATLEWLERGQEPLDETSARSSKLAGGR